MNILIVDDDPKEIEIARLALWDVGGIRSASTSAEALQLLKDETIDLCLVDLRLAAGRSGLELVAKVTVPCIVLTNFPEDAAAMAAAAALPACMGFASKELIGSQHCSANFMRLMEFVILKFNHAKNE